MFEPADGTVVRFTMGYYYHYVAVRQGNHSVTTASHDSKSKRHLLPPGYWDISHQEDWSSSQGKAQHSRLPRRGITSSTTIRVYLNIAKSSASRSRDSPLRRFSFADTANAVRGAQLSLATSTNRFCRVSTSAVPCVSG